MASAMAASVCAGVRVVSSSRGVSNETTQHRHCASFAGIQNAGICVRLGALSSSIFVNSDGGATANAMLKSRCLRPSSSSSSPAWASRRLAIVAAGEIERSYIMIKPDGVQRGLVGEIISRFEKKGFVLKGLKLFQTPRALAEEHYGELKERPFFPKLVDYIVSGPVVAMVWEGPGVVASARKLIGVTNPLNAEPGTIRGDFGVNTGRNVIHGSDSTANGEREIALWFKDGEVIEWELTLTPWILE